MTGLLETLVVLSLIVVAAVVVGTVMVVVPFVVGVDMAERRGFSTQRWGAVCLLATAIMLLLGYVVLTHDLTKVLLVPAAAVGWAGPGLLALLDSSQRALGGLQGAHEH